MLPTFIILFREVLEIAIILSIVLAATRGVPGRGGWVWLGIAGGVVGSSLVAVFAEAISNAVEGMGQEVFNAIVLVLAAVMIGWTVVWMKRHARALSRHIKQVGQAVSEGRLPLYSVALVVSLAMWREGAEIVLFMAGILASTNESLLAILAGGMAGTLVAAAIGLLLYFGLITLSTRHLFSISGWLLILVACGMGAQAAGYLVQAGMLPELMAPLWDTSGVLPEGSLIGKILHAMIGYDERPSAMQALWYIATFALIVTALRLTRDSKPAASAGAKPATAAQ